jgi:hypothetical protein
MTKKMIIGACLFTFLSIFVLGATNGMAAPAPKAVKEVVDYFYNGQADGPILTDAKLCKSIAALECEAAIDPKSFTVGEVLHVWMQFFVPKNGPSLLKKVWPTSGSLILLQSNSPSDKFSL